ncbi:MAG TPA: YjbE family putative metal transport protein [Polyangiales bacterium]|nr:YjbE family putative metal transport protein [Polyangiales bacterium]
MDLSIPQHFWLGLWQIVIVDVLLSGDNAVVIALACRNLADRIRNRAVIFGTLGAVAVRVAFVFTISTLMLIPALKLIGGLLLLWIGIKLMLPEEGDGEDGIKGSANVWGAIRTIVIADVVMSLDNVIGIVAAAKGSLLLVITGLLLSIPLIVFGSRLVLKVLQRFPVLVMAGAGLLGWLGGEIMAGDPLVKKVWPTLDHTDARIIAVIGAAIVITVGTWLKRRALEQRQLATVHAEEK